MSRMDKGFVCIRLIQVIQDMDKKEEVLHKNFKSDGDEVFPGFEAILYAPYIDVLVEVLEEVLELPDDLELQEYIIDLCESDKEPMKIYDEIRESIKEYMKEHYH